MSLLAFAVWALLGCAPSSGLEGSTVVSPPTAIRTTPSAPHPDAKRVLVVINRASPASIAVGEYYQAKRGIPGANVLRIETVTTDNVPEAEFRRSILDPIRTKIRAIPDPIDFIVMTKGVPIRINDGRGYSVDGHVAAMHQTFEPMPLEGSGKTISNEDLRRSMNPYFNKAERFSSQKYNLYLVTRLDGYTAEAAKRLVDSSVNAQPNRGPFLIDVDASRTSGGYLVMNNAMRKAAEVLRGKGFQVLLDDRPEFAESSEPLAGYVTWGSNDRAFRQEAYAAMRFKPGAIGETFVSSSGRTFGRVSTGQSVVSDLIEGGITGVKGYVSEPYTIALARPELLYDRYTMGFNLAESFYMASMVIKWKDMVIGDPLCAPYDRRVR